VVHYQGGKMISWPFFRKKNTQPSMGLGIAFGGGSIRGIAHVGVVKTLEKYNIIPACVAGTSAGSIVAAMVACGFNAARIQEIALKLDWFSMIQPHLKLTGIFSSKKIQHLLQSILPVKYFGETRLPLAIVATDIITGQPVVFDQPDDEIATAVMASCSVPGLYAPVAYKHHMLVDGCLVNNIPVSLLKKFNPKAILAVNVVPKAPMLESPKNMFAVLSRMHDVYQYRSVADETKLADIVLEPLKEYISVLKPSHALYERMITDGEAATEKIIKQLAQRLT
jgi:NTE family protein